MNSREIQTDIELWAQKQDFTAPYGIITGDHINKKGVKCLSVTFGRARSLDATVEIYNRKFMILRTNVHGSKVFKDYDDLRQFLSTL